MVEITSYGPVNRHITEYLTTDKRVRQYRCKTLQNPDYFYNGSVYAPVDPISKLDTSTGKAGNIFLRDKGIVSVGTKKADDGYKLFGLRPDENQNGSEQFEISIESVELNGKRKSINLKEKDRIEVNQITTTFGDLIYAQRARQRFRLMVLADNTTDDFKIVFRLHMTGLTPVYRADLDEWWIYNEKGQFRFRLGRPYLIDPATMNPLDGIFTPLVQHSLAEVSPSEYLYTKEPTEAFGKVDLPNSFLVDVDTVYSSTADGRVQYTSIADWATVHDAVTGNFARTSDTASTMGVVKVTNYDIYRFFYYYSLSGLSGTVTAASENFYCSAITGSPDGSSQQGTQADTLTTADYDAFSDSSFGNVAFVINQYNAINYNAGGISAVESTLGSTFKTALRNYTYDYLNSAPASNNFATLRFADYADTTYDPYLSITILSSTTDIRIVSLLYNQYRKRR